MLQPPGRPELARTTASITVLVAIIEHDRGHQREASGWFATAASAADEFAWGAVHAGGQLYQERRFQL